MSDPVTNFDADDVLESVRRLVRSSRAPADARAAKADAAHAPTAQTAPVTSAEPGRLVLTPALRVLESRDIARRHADPLDDTAPMPAPELVEPHEAPREISEMVQRIEAAVTRQLGQWEPDGSEPAPPDRAGLEDDEAMILPVAPVEEAAEDDAPGDIPEFRHTGANAAFLDMLRNSRTRRDDGDLPTLTLTAADIASDQTVDRPRADFVEHGIDPIPEPDPTLEALIAEAEALDAPDDLMLAAGDDAETALAEDRGEEAPFAEVEPEPQVAASVSVFGRRIFRRPDAEPDTVAPAPDAAATDDEPDLDAAPDDPAPPVWQELSPEDEALLAEDEDAAYYQDDLDPELAEHDAGDEADAYDPELDNYLNGPSPIDDARLRQMIVDVLRDELQGPLGERITRNVRKLVRREIYRVLSSEDLA